MSRPTAARRHVLLLRGVNVGGNKKVPMAGLRQMLSDLGHGNVRTLLNSGNAVFDAPRAAPSGRLAAAIEAAIEKTFGFSSRSFVLTAAELEVAIDENPLVSRATNPSRLLVAFLMEADDTRRLKTLPTQPWGDDAIAIGSRAAYLWCSEGISRSELPDAVGRAVKHDVTTRNWATVLKLQAMCREGSAGSGSSAG